MAFGLWRGDSDDSPRRAFDNTTRFDSFGDPPWMKQDLIVRNVQDEHGFERLAGFLGRQAPSKSFPHHNETADVKPLR